jgi:hypothetical protein
MPPPPDDDAAAAAPPAGVGLDDGAGSGDVVGCARALSAAVAREPEIMSTPSDIMPEKNAGRLDDADAATAGSLLPSREGPAFAVPDDAGITTLAMAGSFSAGGARRPGGICMLAIAGSCSPGGICMLAMAGSCGMCMLAIAGSCNGPAARASGTASAAAPAPPATARVAPGCSFSMSASILLTSVLAAGAAGAGGGAASAGTVPGGASRSMRMRSMTLLSPSDAATTSAAAASLLRRRCMSRSASNCCSCAWNDACRRLSRGTSAASASNHTRDQGVIACS